MVWDRVHDEYLAATDMLQGRGERPREPFDPSRLLQPLSRDANIQGTMFVSDTQAPRVPSARGDTTRGTRGDEHG